MTVTLLTSKGDSVFSYLQDYSFVANFIQLP